MPFDRLAQAMVGTAPIEKNTQRHLGRVYASLAGASLMAALGCYVFMLTHVPVMLPSLVGMGLIMGMQGMPAYRENERMAMFAAFAFSQGMTLGNVVEIALFVDPQLVLGALLGTLAIFTGFSLAALRSERRSFLYLGGMLSSMLGYMSLGLLANYFFQSQMFWNINLYGGLMIFAGYIVFDTQLIIERASAGDRDYLNHALMLFVDLAAIFVRVLVILLKMQEKARNHNRGGTTDLEHSTADLLPVHTHT
eukprot:CAMPEP_0184524678 /NCGR_PEP_ID=MMETSP0198_2-20121128/9660_1 /TAXON_ID=1112570 /ORGANISM="Thraustochytrium sp., Strain LLF1b" /LENGTH=250 /DNA_ID=CAMNT_0026916021 /DNA_START=145 /DNA_END=898 /DNA_ORIENTATION=+